MSIVRAIYEGGVFRPTCPVKLPEACEVEFDPHPVGDVQPIIFITNPKLSVEEFGRMLDQMAATPPGKVLPRDFSREDMYDDHD